MQTQNFKINRALDPKKLHDEFHANGRLHIPHFLEADGAEQLLNYLKASVLWKLVINSDEKLFELDRKMQAELSPEQKEMLDQAAYANARHGFQFRYETIRVADEDAERTKNGTMIDAFAQFLSSEPVLSFFQSVLGRAEISYADAQATAYGPSHFLTAHDDDVIGKKRKAAFVMNLSKNWSADWGGLLVFHESGKSLAEAMIPSFNSINIFSVPQRHSVSMVTPFVPYRRYSITGWFRSGAKP